MNTSDYVYGSAQMYHEDCNATPAVMVAICMKIDEN